MSALDSGSVRQLFDDDYEAVRSYLRTEYPDLAKVWGQAEAIAAEVVSGGKALNRADLFAQACKLAGNWSARVFEDQIRREQRAQSSGASDHGIGQIPIGERKRIAGALASLSPSCQHVFVERFYNARPLHLLAEEMHLTHSRVQKYLKRAFRQVHQSRMGAEGVECNAQVSGEALGWAAALWTYDRPNDLTIRHRAWLAASPEHGRASLAVEKSLTAASQARREVMALMARPRQKLSTSHGLRWAMVALCLADLIGTAKALPLF